jgi:hypothetical protein
MGEGEGEFEIFYQAADNLEMTSDATDGGREKSIVIAIFKSCITNCSLSTSVLLFPHPFA